MKAEKTFSVGGKLRVFVRRISALKINAKTVSSGCKEMVPKENLEL